MKVSFLFLCLAGFLSIFITYIVGKSILAFLPKSKGLFFHLFVSLAIGTLVLVLLFSLVASGGKTIHVILLPILGLIFYKYRKLFSKPTITIKEIKTELLWAVLLFIPIFLYQSFFFFDFVNGTVKSLLWDNYSYASYIDSLRLWGTETRYVDMNYFSSEFRKGLVPYHYSELWFSAFWASLFKLSSIKAYYFITNTLLITAFTTGVCSLFEQKIEQKYVIVPLSFLLLFIAGLTFPFYGHSDLLPSLWFKNMSMLGILGSKMAFIYLYLLMAIVLLKRGESFLGNSLLLTIPLFSIGLMPGIWGGMLLMQLFDIVKQRFKINRNHVYVFGFIGLAVFLYALFYHVFKSSNVDDYTSKYIFSHGIFKSVHGGITIANIKIVIANFICYSIPTIGLNMLKMLVFFFPFLIIIYRSVFKNARLWLFTLIAVICGAAITTLCAGILDTGQFTTNLSVLMAVLIIIGIAELVVDTDSMSSKINYVQLFFVGLFLLYNLIGTIQSRDAMKTWHDDDHEFLKKIAETVKSEKTVVCLVLLSEEEYARQPYLWWYDRNDADIVSQYSNAHFIFTLANPELYFKYKEIRESEKFAYNYLTPINAWRNKNNGQDLEAFIKQFSIRYFYVKKSVKLPLYITRNTKNSIESTKTGTNFIELQ